MPTSRFLTLDDLTHLPRPVWLIEGMFEANSLVMLAGPSYSFKSFLALDWILSMASGRRWLGKPTVPSKVLYVLGEGKANLLKRIQTWIWYNQLDDVEKKRLNENFRVTFDVPQLAQKSSVDNLVSALADTGYAPSVIVIDTFARSFVGLDENSNSDAGLWIEQADRLRQNGLTVIFLHHTKKNTEFGVNYRGASAIIAGMDTSMMMIRDMATNRATLSMQKQKDHTEMKPLHFSGLVVQPAGDPEGSIVLIPQTPIDERFTEEGKKIEEVTLQLLSEVHESDRARARLLAQNFGMTESAAQARIRRLRKEKHLETEEDLSPQLVSYPVEPKLAVDMRGAQW